MILLSLTDEGGLLIIAEKEMPYSSLNSFTSLNALHGKDLYHKELIIQKHCILSSLTDGH